MSSAAATLSGRFVSVRDRGGTIDLGPVLRRLSHLAPLQHLNADALRSNLRQARDVGARTQLLSEHQVLPAPRVLLRGWACHKRILADGRKQIMHLLLPGDFIGSPCRRGMLSCSSVTTITSARIGLFDELVDPALRDVLLSSDAQTEAYLMNHLVRLGQQNAYERFAHLLLEIRERLTASGIPVTPFFDLPLTQEAIANVLGVTSVHANRTIQQMRRDGLIEFQAGKVQLPDPEALMQIADYQPTVVTNWQGAR
jgi:CRP-like cAMP-binding protein